jgi:hypothetical protein
MRVQSRRLATERRNKAALLLAAVAAAACPLSSRGASDSWVGSTFGSDNWSTPTNWSLGHQPGNLDEAFLAGSSFQGTSVIYDAAATATNLSSLTLDSAALRPITLYQSVNSLTTAIEFVGSNRTGNLNISGGTHTVKGALFFGNIAGSSGNGSLSDGTLNTVYTYVGYSGGGSFNQTGGTHTIAQGLYLGVNASGASGAYTLAGGTLSSAGTTVGAGGTGVFTQNGGSHIPGQLTLGFVAGSSGTYDLNSGSVASTYQEFVGFQSNGVFNQTGGSHSVSGTSGVSIGVTPEGSGTYTLSAGTLMVPNGPMYVGDSGAGVFNQSGGSNSIGTLVVAYSAFGSGTYTLGGGTLSASAATIVGGSGTGVFTQTGGSHMTGEMELGQAAGSSGTYNLNDGSLASSNEEDVGSEGKGVFNQTGGSNTGNILSVGFLTGSSGTYSLSNGASLNATEEMGFYGTGVFNQSGGSNAAGDLTLGTGIGSSGTYNLSNGASLNVSNSETVGDLGTGVFNQSGGSHSVSATNGVTIGFLASGSGTYTLSGGALMVPNGPIYVGYLGTGIFNQSGGGNTIANLYLGYSGPTGTNPASFGAYSLSNGATLNVTGSEYVGYSGRASFTQTGGSHTVNGSGTNGLFVTYTPGGSGTFTLSGGTLSLPAATLYVGYQGNGVVNQSGGASNPFSLAVGYLAPSGTNPAGAGVYNLSGGSLNVTSAEYIGYGGYGTLNQSGGTHTAGTLFITTLPGSSGTVNLSGGSLTAVSTLNNGTLNQTGTSVSNFGVLSGTGAFVLGTDFGAPTRATVARFDQSSITIKFTGSLTVATNATRFTNTVTNLQINGGATLDLGNHELLTLTAPDTIKSYLAAAYDPNGNADWSKPGLSSSLAKSNPAKFSVGYAFGGDQSAQDAGVTLHDGTPLGPTQTVARAVLTGDANMDGTVDFFDITQVLGYKYNTGQPASYTDGDLNYDGVVDFFDLAVLLSANYNIGEVFAAPAAAAEPALATVPEPAGLAEP